MLQKEELRVLKDYIEKRSQRFSEPAILMEILDHFACKVEELRQQEPHLSLDEAMLQAHASFGVRGFAPLADQAQSSLYQRYRKISMREMKAILQSYQVLFLISVGLLSYRVLSLLYPLLPQTSLFRILDIPLLVYLLLLGVLRLLHARKLKNHPLHWSTAGACSPLALLFRHPGVYFAYCLIGGFSGHYPEWSLYLLPLMIVFTAFSYLVALRLYRQAAKDVAASQAVLAG